MQSILDRALKGEDFAALARQYTEDPGSKESGGLYENFPRGQMVKPFEDAAFKLPIGSISDIVETQYGYHVLLIVNRARETRPFEQVKAELETNLINAKKRSFRSDLVEQLKKESNFTVNI